MMLLQSSNVRGVTWDFKTIPTDSPTELVFFEFSWINRWGTHTAVVLWGCSARLARLTGDAGMLRAAGKRVNMATQQVVSPEGVMVF